MTTVHNHNLIRSIWAVGRNYALHAAEMKAEVPQQPFFFLKSGACIDSSSRIRLPAWSSEVHHELEIALWIDESLNFSHVTLALDLTARDAQNLAKSKGQPWTLAKSFTGACPLGPWLNLGELAAPETLACELRKNGRPVQQGRWADMLFKPAELLDYAKKHYPLGAHDVLLTGTPAGVGPLRSGDSLDAVLQSEGREILACHWDVI